MGENKGFRVRITFSTELKDDDKYLVYINLNHTETVKEFIKHIKETFHIDEELCIKVDDCVLPDAETILVIQPDDVLKVCRRELKRESLFDIKNNDNKTSVWESKGKRKASMLTDGIGDCLKLLWEKKTELENTATVKQDLDVNERVSLNHSQNNCEENDVDDSEYSFDSVKKKRKRTRKRKNDTSFTEASTCSSIKSFNMDKPKQPGVESDLKTSNHIFFNEEPLDSEINASQEKIIVHENHKSDSNGNDDWKKKLFILATKPQENKIFDRSAHIRSMKNERDFIASINDINVGDCITFKVFKLSESNTPEVSSAIIGNIIKINLTNQHLTLLITENEEALINSESMSVEVEADSSSKKAQGIILKWTDLIEPQLTSTSEYFI